MRKRAISSITVLLVFVLSFFQSAPDPAAAAINKAETALFFSQGQATYNPQDEAGSQQQAVQDFMAQGLVQALGKFLSPSQMGTHYPEIQKKILSTPSKYIDSYQVFSESRAAATYRVIGQVTVAMEVLKKDLEEFGFVSTRKRQETASEPGSSAEPADESTGSGVVSPSGDEAATEDDVIAETPAYPVATAEKAPASPGVRGLSVTRKEILWAVPEKWEQEWVLPTDERDTRSLFASAIGRELGDYDFSIQLPQAGSTKMDLSGNIPRSQVIAVAEGLGIQEVVTGTVAIKRDRDARQVWIEANLRVIRIGAGKSEFEIRKMQSMEELSNHDGAMELAARIAPELNEMMGGTARSKSKATAAGSGTEAAPEGGASKAGDAVGNWTITLPVAQYAYWKEVEALLRRQFKGMQVTSFEMGSSGAAVKVNGISGSFLSSMNGTSLPSGALIQVESVSAESKTIKLSFTPSGKGRTE
ncbi:MAG: hypothetical protein AB9866_20205 [Syntrophobacteraceae bacterium]